MSDGFDKLAQLLGEKLGDGKPEGSAKKSERGQLDELLQQLLKNGGKKSGLTKTEQATMLEDLAHGPNDLKVGDFVRRNKHGKLRYRFPTKGYVGRVEAVFPYQICPDGDWINGIIHGIHEDGKICCYGVDLRFYQKVEIEKPESAADDKKAT